MLFSAEKKGNSKTAVTQGQDNPNTKPDPTWVHEIFQGTLTNETRCLNCETVSKEKRHLGHLVSSFFVPVIVFPFLFVVVWN